MFKKFGLPIIAVLAVWGLLSGWASAAAGNSTAELAFEQGLSAFEEGKWGEALTYFDQAIIADPTYATAYHYRGTALLQLNQPEEAIKALEKAKSLDPNTVDVYLDLGTAYQKMGRLNDALAAFKEEVKRHPDSAQAQYSLGYLLITRKEYEAALGPLAKARELDPKMAPAARYYEGSALFALNRPLEAKAAFQEVLGMNPAPELAAACKQYIGLIEGGGTAGGAGGGAPAKRWGIIGALLYQYDSNVIAATSETQFPTSVEGKQISHKDDSRAVLTLFAKWQFLSADPWSAEARYSFYQSLHAELSSFNLQNHAGELVGGRTFSMGGYKSGVTMSYLASVALLGDKLSWYSVDHVVTPTFTIKWSKTFSTAFSYRFIYEDFKEETPNRDNITNGGSVDLYYGYWGTHGMLKGSLGFDYSDAKDKDYDLQRPWLSVGTDLSLPWKIRTRLMLRYQEDKYFRTDANRVDDIFITDFMVFRPIWGPLEANINANYRMNNSTVNSFEYKRTIFGAGILARF